jgi:phage protein U
LRTFRFLRGERAGRGPRSQLSFLGERAAIQGTQTKENTMTSKKHTIYVINTSESGKSYWNRAGVAFGNRDGSFTLKLDILPQTKFQLREERPAKEEEAAAE